MGFPVIGSAHPVPAFMEQQNIILRIRQTNNRVRKSHQGLRSNTPAHLPVIFHSFCKPPDFRASVLYNGYNMSTLHCIGVLSDAC